MFIAEKVHIDSNKCLLYTQSANQILTIPFD